ncbi:MAG: flagellar export chaperone FliS [Desulfobacterales bacterium]
MYQPNGARSYRSTKVVTSDPGRLVIMCYEGAIDQLKIAKRKDAEEEFEARAEAIKKAEDIINELVCSLDFKKGGIIARNLESLYNYMTRRILGADANKKISMLDEVIGMLGELKSAWEEVVAKQTKATAPSYPTASEEPRQAFESVSV